MRRFLLFAVLFALFCVSLSFSAKIPGAIEEVPPITASVQPSGSDTITWSAGKYLTVRRNGSLRNARGFEVISTSTGGVLGVHLINDFSANGSKVYLPYPIPASSGATQRTGLIFDEIDSATTTISTSDIIIWY